MNVRLTYSIRLFTRRIEQLQSLLEIKINEGTLFENIEKLYRQIRMLERQIRDMQFPHIERQQYHTELPPLL
jgi:hypothetical protein